MRKTSKSKSLVELVIQIFVVTYLAFKILTVRIHIIMLEAKT